MSNDLIMYTDGAARGNPGPGGYGAILFWGGHKKELSAATGIPPTTGWSSWLSSPDSKH